MNNTKTHEIKQDGKTYFIEWDKDEGYIAITEAMPEPTTDEVYEYMDTLTEYELSNQTLKELLHNASEGEELFIETYNFVQEE